MAYTVNLASNQYLSTTSAPASGSPMTIACWFRPTANQNGCIVAVGVSSGTNRNQLQIGAGPVLVTASVGTSTQSINTSGVVLNSWCHGASVFTSQSSRVGYVNGVAGTTQATDCGTQITANSILIGARWNTTVGLGFTGDIADVGVWGVALTADEIASLAKGVSCLLVRPQSLVFYAPLIRNLTDEMRGLAITNNNTATVAGHPRIYA